MNPKAMLLTMTVLLTGIASAQTAASSSAPPAAPPANRPPMAMAPMTTAEALAEVVPQMAAKGSPTYAPNLPKRTRRYLITESGAVGDGKTVNTRSIQSAIDKCAENKAGGTVVVPKGVFLSGSIFLKQGVNLLVEKDGVLKGTTNIDDYPEIPELPGGFRGGGTAALVNADGVTGVTISGEGTIDGSGEDWVTQNRRPPGPAAGTAAFAPAAPPPSAAPPAAPRQERGRPRLMAIKNVKDVQISGLNLHNQATWCLWVLYSQNVEIDGVKITAEHNIPTSDGMDLESSKHVHVNHSYLEDDDDCISIKSGKDADGLRVNRPAEDILIENSHFAYGQGGVAMGSEISGGVRNVTTLNCLFDDGNWAPIRFKSQPSRGGVVENITYKDIVVHATRQAFEMNMEWRMVGPRLPDSNPLPVMRNIKIINVTGDVRSVGNIHGLPGSPIQGVTFENCNITADSGFRLDHARSVDLKGLTIKVKQGDPVTTTDVE
ncbi:MAG TPA: glycosyl hydrolase family 28 protein [Acidobacteriaceae bacterium]|nr:glycosyl hydrolase family 28 protein [Acidobacteriaceae bacterium]